MEMTMARPPYELRMATNADVLQDRVVRPILLRIARIGRGGGGVDHALGEHRQGVGVVV